MVKPGALAAAVRRDVPAREGLARDVAASLQRSVGKHAEMFPIQRILVPVDFADSSRQILTHVRSIAERYQGEITLLHVIDNTRATARAAALVDYTVPMPDPEAWEAEVRQELEHFASEELEGLRVVRRMVHGDPAQKIVEMAHSGGFALIAMPTHGHGPIRRFLLGSVTAKVLHDADCPVLTGAHREAPRPAVDGRFQHTLCAIDLGPHSATVLDWARKFACEFTTMLSLVHVVPLVEAGLETQFGWDLQMELRARAEKELDQLKAAKKLPVEAHIEYGEPSRRICTVADRIGADLLVIGRSGHTGVLGRLHAHAYSIIRQACCPIVSV